VQRCAAQANLVLPRIGDELLAPLSAAGLQPLVWKGASLAARYPAAGDRPMDDIDLLFPDGQRSAAIRLLEQHGWRIVEQDREHYDVAMTHPALPGLPVELHEALDLPSQRAFRFTAADLWRARTPITVFGQPAFGLPAETELVALVTHAAKPFHTFDRLIWSVDFAVVIRDAECAGQPVDWDRIEALSTDAQARTAMAVALTHAARLGGVSPVHLREISGSRARQSALAPVLAAEWPLQLWDEGTRHRLSYALIDDRRLMVRRASAEALGRGPRQAPAASAGMVWKAARRWLMSSRVARRCD
jgi:hypothetical protein